MSSRTARIMIAYPQPDQPVEFKTSGGYTHAGLVFNQDCTWTMAAHGFSPQSILKRTKAAAGRKYVGHPQALVNSMVAISRLWEETAPNVARYFGHHRLTVTAVFRPGHGWVNVSWDAGRTNLRRMERDGYTGVQFEGCDAQGRVRHPEFMMTEISRSLRNRNA
jgi:hypothetical protein